MNEKGKWKISVKKIHDNRWINKSYETDKEKMWMKKETELRLY